MNEWMSAFILVNFSAFHEIFVFLLSNLFFYFDSFLHIPPVSTSNRSSLVYHWFVTGPSLVYDWSLTGPSLDNDWSLVSGPWLLVLVSFHSLPAASTSSCVLFPSSRSLLAAAAGSSWTPAGPDESPPTHESSALRRQRAGQQWATRPVPEWTTSSELLSEHMLLLHKMNQSCASDEQVNMTQSSTDFRSGLFQEEPLKSLCVFWPQQSETVFIDQILFLINTNTYIDFSVLLTGSISRLNRSCSSKHHQSRLQLRNQRFEAFCTEEHDTHTHYV